MARVRAATQDDIQWIVALGADMQQESPRFSQLGYDRKKVASLLQTLIDANDGLVLVVDTPSGVVGMLMGFVAEQFFSNAVTAQELVVYVAPEHRGGTAAMRMVKTFEAWAFDHGAQEIVLGVSTEVDASRTAGLYQRLGYQPSGHLLRKRCT